MNLVRPIESLLAICLVCLPLLAGANGEVNVYSYRQPFLVKPLFDAFTQDTGIGVNVVSASKGLVERLKSEGANSPADLIFTVDISRLTQAKEAGVTRAVNSAVLEAKIPANYRDPEGHWYGLTARARIIVASRERVPEGSVTTYEDLADPRFKGRLCTRSAKHVYMLGLVGAMIVHHGEKEAERWLRGVKANLARKPQGNDRAQVRAIKEGVCDIAVINHYYMGKMMENDEQRPWAESVYVVFPDQAGYGAHVNVSGVAMTISSPNRARALELMEFLASEKAQRIYAEQNNEYPVSPGVPRSAVLDALGEFKADDLALADIAAQRKLASQLADRVDYDG